MYQSRSGADVKEANRWTGNHGTPQQLYSGPPCSFTAGIFQSTFSWEATLYDRIRHQGPKVAASGPEYFKARGSCRDLKALSFCRGRNGDCFISVPVSTAMSSTDTKQACVKVYGDPSCKQLLAKIQPGTGCHANLVRNFPSLNNKSNLFVAAKIVMSPE